MTRCVSTPVAIVRVMSELRNPLAEKVLDITRTLAIILRSICLSLYLWGSVLTESVKGLSSGTRLASGDGNVVSAI